MNRTKLKNYAPKARREFIQAVTDRAAFYGLKEERGSLVVLPTAEHSDGVVIGGKVFSRKIADQRRSLEGRLLQHGFSQTMEALAYTWFNRLIAIRYMELHGHLDHGYRVLSHPDGKPVPEILEHAEHVDLPGLDKQKVIELKIDGTKDAELYRLLLIAQCNALRDAMPFLFERIDDETELLLPVNLLHSDSLIRNLVSEIDEEDWQEVEILGWLYESYISERHEAIIGRVVASEDIPAATQRFTPKWIVRYLVQNTLGRLWLATYPHSTLRQQMKYYIEPAEQTTDVQDQLRSITPTNLNPEELTFLDPACGSAHILVEAYELFKLIYQERGYRAKDIPTLILTKNLFGLEIDDRAAQLAAFALLMKARADDRRLFHADNKVQPNVVALQETKGLSAKEITAFLNEPVLIEPMPPSAQLFEDEGGLFSKARMSAAGDLAQADIAALIDLFEDAKTFGALIQVSPKLAAKLRDIEQRVKLVARYGAGFNRLYAGNFLPFVEQAKLLACNFDCVVANPPYMGSKYYVGRLKQFVKGHYKGARGDLYACFIERNASLAKPNGFVGMITIPNWMFLSSFEDVRKTLFENQTFDTFIHNGRGVFGSDFGSCSFVFRNYNLPTYRGTFRRLFDKQGSVASNEELEGRFSTSPDYTPSNADFAKISGSPVAYWASDNVRMAFVEGVALGTIASPKIGMRTGDNERFLRQWHEVPIHKISFGCGSAAEALLQGAKWLPYNKGGEYRKWYGNNSFVVNWENDGQEIKQATREAYPELGDNLGWKISNESFYFRPCATWTATSASFFGVRYTEKGFLFDVKGSCCFSTDELLPIVLALLTTKQVSYFLGFLNPSIEFQTVDLARIPVHSSICSDQGLKEKITSIAFKCISLARVEWDSFETSWDFQSLPVLQHSAATLQGSQEAADAECYERFHQMRELEQDNNRIFIDAYGLQSELSPDVEDDQITLHRPNREEDVKRLLSYAIGCMMGRYSLNKPGLVYANIANIDFDPGQHTIFPPDRDGILPLTDRDWGLEDDTGRRIEEFVSVVWPKENLAENLRFIADSLGHAKNEPPSDTIRRYCATGFYKDHLRWYKRRPIYWLFSSGKERAFQCLVYLHRYHEGTMARMRTEYVIPLQSRVATRIEQLEGDKAKATSTSHRKKLQKEQDDLKKQQTELLAFDEKLKHAAEQKIKLDLDDGVKVNYAKFGDLLAEVKAVTGGTDE